jgi:VCBS repeat-containing protein
MTAVPAANVSHGSLTLNANGSFTYTPAADYNGTDQFTYKVNDTRCYSSAGTVTITVNAVNDAPSFTKGTDKTVMEDAGAQSFSSWASAISPGPANESAQTVNFDVSNNNTTLFSAQPAISSANVLTFTAAANANGAATVSVRAHDNGGTANGGVDTSAWQTFTITVTSVNDAPSFTKGSDQNVLENAGPQTVNGWATAISPGPANEASQVASFDVTSNHSSLFSIQPAISSAGVLSFLTATDSSGSATVSVRAHDNGGTANGGVDTSAWQTFTVTVNGVNHAPSFTKGTDKTVLEDGGAQSFAGWATAISPGPANESSQTVNFDVTNSNNALFSTQPAVSAANVLTFTPAANANGSATVSIRAHDNGGTANNGIDTSAWQTFAITVTAVNDAPSFTPGNNETILENAGPQTFSNWSPAISAGPSNEGSQVVSFDVTNNHSSLFSIQPTISSSNVLTFLTATDSSGTATVSVRAHDNGGTANGGVDTSAWQTFTVTVTGVNHAPSFTKGTDKTVLEDGGAQSFAGWATAISAGPANESSQTVNFDVTNSNNALFSTQPAVSAANVLTFTPTANANGSATVSVRAHDNGGTANNGIDTSAWQTFTITVTAINDAPSFTEGSNQTVLENVGPQTFNSWASAISAGPYNESSQTVSFDVTNTQPSLFSVPPAVSSAGALTFGPATDSIGIDTVKVRAHDNGGTSNGGIDTSAWQSFTIMVTGVNHAPSFVKGSNETVLENGGLQTFAGWATAISAGPANESFQAVSFDVSNNHGSLFLVQPAISSAGALTFLPAADSSGTATVSVRAHDNGGTANGGADTSTWQTFTIAVTLVNHVPSFTKGPDKTVLESSGLQTFSGWVTAISAGPANESSQAVSFDATSNHASLFSVQPSVSSAGVLTFFPATDSVGSATVSVRAHDNGGTANGGVDTSAWQTFTVTVSGINHAPSFTKGNNDTVLENAGPQTLVGWATSISAGPPYESSQAASFDVTNDHGSLFAIQPAVSSAGVLTFLPATDSSGTATVSVRAHDNGGTSNGGIDTSAWQTFTIAVTLVNHAPSFTKGSDKTVPENATAQSFPGWIAAASPGPANESPQTVNFDVVASAPSLFSVQPAVSAAGTLSFTPATYAFGAASVSVRAHDNGVTGNNGVDTSGWQTFTINITHVNNPPNPPAGIFTASGASLTPADSLKWAAATDPDSSDVLRYVVNVSGVNDFSSVMLVDTVRTLSDRLNAIVNHRALRRGQIYYWRVKAIDNSNASSSWAGGAAQPFVFASSAPAAFSLTSPAQNAEDSTLLPSFSWGVSSVGPGDTLTYRLQVDSSAAFSSPTVSQAALTSTSYALTAKLVNNKSYYWRVWAIGCYGDSTVSTQTFTLFTLQVNHPPSLSLPLLPVNNTDRARADSLWWTGHDVDPGDTLKYDIRLCATFDFAKIAASKTAWPLQAIAIKDLDNVDSLVENHVYYWQVNSHDQHGASSGFTNGTNTIVYHNVNHAPNMPDQLRPSGNVAIGPTDFLRWRCADPDSVGLTPDTTHFTVVISATGDFSSPLGITLNIPRDSIQINQLVNNAAMLDNNKYYWKVVGIDNHGLSGPYTDGTAYFYYNKVNDPPQTPTVFLPATGASILSSDSLHWSAAVDPDPFDSETYVLQVARTADFTTPIGVDTLAATAMAVNRLNNYYNYKSGTVYYWRVKAYDRALASLGWSSGLSFTYSSIAPQLPAAYYPLNDSVLFPTEPIFWTRSADPSRGLHDSIWYVLQVSSAAAFSTVVSTDTIADTQRVVQNLKGYGQLLDDNRYYWRLTVVDNHGSANGPSQVMRFYLNKTNNPPSMPLVISPVDSQVIQKAGLFRWSRAVDPDPGNTVSYRIVGALDSSFADTVLRVTGIQDTAISVDSLLARNTVVKPDTALKPSQDTGGFLDDHFYYWNVAAVDNHNSSSPVGTAGYFYFNPVSDTPGIATNLQPAFGLMTFPTALLQWKALVKNEFRTTLRSTIEFATDSLFTTPLFEDTTTQAQQLQVAFLHDTASLQVQISALRDTALIPKERYVF